MDNIPQSNYSRFKAQLKADIEASWATQKIVFGQPGDIVQFPHAIVRASVAIAPQGVRFNEEVWRFEIEGCWNKGIPEDSDEFLLDLGNLLRLRLAPYDYEDVPPEAPDYAGIGYTPRVTAIRPVDGDEKRELGVRLSFEVRAKVYV